MGTSTGGDSINDDDMDESIEPELSQVWLPYEGKKSPDEWTVCLHHIIALTYFNASFSGV